MGSAWYYFYSPWGRKIFLPYLFFGGAPGNLLAIEPWALVSQVCHCLLLLKLMVTGFKSILGVYERGRIGN